MKALRIAQGPRLIAGYSLVVGIARMIPSLGFLTLAWSLTVEDYGRAAVLASIYAILVALTDSGFDAAASMRIAAGDEETAILLASFRARLGAWVVGTGICSAMLFFAIKLLDAYTLSAFAVICIGAMLTGVTSTLRVIEREHQPWAEARLIVMEKFLIGTTTAVFGWMTKGYMGYALGTVVAPVCLLLVTSPFRARLWYLLLSIRTKSSSRQMFRTAMPIGISIYASLLYWRLDVLLISRILGDQSAGAYAQGYYPIMAAAMLPGAGGVLLLRRSAFSMHKTPTVVATATTVGGIAAMFLWLWGDTTLTYLQFLTEVDSVNVLRIAAFSLPFVFANPFLAMALRREGLAWRVTFVSLVGVVLNTLSVVFLVHRLGVEGAAWASVGTELGVFTLLVVLMATANTTQQKSPMRLSCG